MGASADKVIQGDQQVYGIVHGLTDTKYTWYLKINEKFIKLGEPLH